MSYTLWAVQVALAALFLFAGGMKLAQPLEKMAGPPALPGAFLRLIGLAEACGALGLILPGSCKSGRDSRYRLGKKPAVTENGGYGRHAHALSFSWTYYQPVGSYPFSRRQRSTKLV